MIGYMYRGDLLAHSRVGHRRQAYNWADSSR